MAKQSDQIDGVLKRTKRRTVGDFNSAKKQPAAFSQESRSQNTRTGFSKIQKKRKLITASIEEDSQMNETESKGTSTTKRARKRARKVARRQRDARRPKWLRILRRVGAVSAAAMVLVGAVLGIKAFLAFQNIIDRDGALAFQDLLGSSTLDGEEDGRVNVMLVGIGGDTHTAGDLADSIMIASLNTRDNQLAMLSIPRDLYVDIPGYWSSRINAAHAMGIDQDHPGGGIALLEETIEHNFGVPIHYYARVDFQGFVQAVDAVGGVTITLEEAVYDNNFEWQYGPDALKLPAGENNLDGQTALLLARARGAGSVSYGLSGSDFSRAKHQRQILLALKDKVLSAGTFSNPLKIAGLIDAAGSHARTDMEVSEMMRVREIMESVSSDDILALGLDTGANSFLTGSNIGGASVLVPKTGDFLAIREFMDNIFIEGYLQQEQPVVDILNGTGIAGYATQESYDLIDLGLQVNYVGDAPKSNHKHTKVYDMTNGEKPFSANLLKEQYDATMVSGDELPENIATYADFVIILGNDEDTTTQQNQAAQ